ncbi:MAG: response regulator [Blautia obeum]
MKLLIVDDEELTRTGVITSLDWASLGIDEVLQADDGVHGLETARLCKPEIILCDVRMPRMDGISMLERLEKFLPDTVPIFMSGYSDKEYLKAAIKLKAVNYIENLFLFQKLKLPFAKPVNFTPKSPFPQRRNTAFNGNCFPSGTAADSSLRKQQPDHRAALI